MLAAARAAIKEDLHADGDEELSRRVSPSRSESLSPGKRSPTRVSFSREVSVHESASNSQRTSSDGTDLANNDGPEEESEEDSRTASPSNETDLPSDATDLPEPSAALDRVSLASQASEKPDPLSRGGSAPGSAPATPKRESLDRVSICSEKLDQSSVSSAPGTPKRDSSEAELDGRGDASKRPKTSGLFAAEDAPTLRSLV
jgi:hypothetical protein